MDSPHDDVPRPSTLHTHSKPGSRDGQCVCVCVRQAQPWWDRTTPNTHTHTHTFETNHYEPHTKSRLPTPHTVLPERTLGGKSWSRKTRVFCFKLASSRLEREFSGQADQGDFEKKRSSSGQCLQEEHYLVQWHSSPRPSMEQTHFKKLGRSGLARPTHRSRPMVSHYFLSNVAFLA